MGLMNHLLALKDPYYELTPFHWPYEVDGKDWQRIFSENYASADFYSRFPQPVIEHIKNKDWEKTIIVQDFDIQQDLGHLRRLLILEWLIENNHAETLAQTLFSEGEYIYTTDYLGYAFEKLVNKEHKAMAEHIKTNLVPPLKKVISKLRKPYLKDEAFEGSAKLIKEKLEFDVKFAMGDYLYIYHNDKYMPSFSEEVMTNVVLKPLSNAQIKTDGYTFEYFPNNEFKLSDFGIKVQRIDNEYGDLDFSAKVSVENTSDDTYVIIDFQGIDKDGFEVESFSFFGDIAIGERRLLTKKFDMVDASVFQKIQSWNISIG